MNEAKARVLVADDEASIRFVLREALEEAGHEVVDVDSGETAWSLLPGGGFDIAFLDIRMPDLRLSCSSGARPRQRWS
jgi:CheY-like chemotaxis protein